MRFFLIISALIGLAASASVLDLDFNKNGPHIELKNGYGGGGEAGDDKEKDKVSILAPVFNFDMRKGGCIKCTYYNVNFNSYIRRMLSQWTRRWR